MKNIKTKILSIILVCILGLSFAVGCGLITTDEDVDNDRILVKVGVTDDYYDSITKREYLSTLYSQGSEYIQQGQSIEDVMEYIYNLVTENRISIQVSILGMVENYYANQYVDKQIKLSEILTKPKKDESVRKVSEALKNLIEKDTTDEYIKNYYISAWNEVAKAEMDSIKTFVDQIKLEEDSEYEEEAKPAEKEKRALRTQSENDKEHSKFDILVSANDFKGDKTSLEEARKMLEIFRNPMKDDNLQTLFDYEFLETDDFFPKKEEIGKIYEKAYKRYDAQIKNAKIFLGEDKLKYDGSYGNNKFVERYFELVLVGKLESACINIYGNISADKVVKEKFNTIKDGKSQMYWLLKDRFDALQMQQKQRFDNDRNSYITTLNALSEETFLLASATGLGGYGYVKHILIGMEEKESLRWQQVSSLAISEAEKLALRQEILNRISVKDLRDENEDEDFKPCEDTWTIDDFYNDVFREAFSKNDKNPVVAEGKFSGKPVYMVNSIPNYTVKDFDENLFIENKEYNFATDGKAGATDRFVDWIFTYNTDPGMFNNKVDYIINQTPSPYLSNEKFMKEFAQAARDVIIAGEGAYTMIATDYGWHIVYCSEVVFPFSEGLLTFNESLLPKILNNYIDPENGTNFAEEQDPVYKIFKIIREQIAENAYVAEMTKLSESYREGLEVKIGEKTIKPYVTKYNNLYNEIVKQVNG